MQPFVAPMMMGATAVVFTPSTQTFYSEYPTGSEQTVNRPAGATKLVIEVTSVGGGSIDSSSGGYGGAGGGYAKRTITGASIPNQLVLFAGDSVVVSNANPDPSRDLYVKSSTGTTLCAATSAQTTPAGGPPTPGAGTVGDVKITGDTTTTIRGAAGSGPYGGAANPNELGPSNNGNDYGGGSDANNGRNIQPGAGRVDLTWS